MRRVGSTPVKAPGAHIPTPTPDPMLSLTLLTALAPLTIAPSTGSPTETPRSALLELGSELGLPAATLTAPAPASLQASSGGPSWSYVQVAAGTTTFEVLGTDIDLDTVDVKAGAQVSDTVYLHATYQESDFTLGGKATGLKIGAGLRAPLSPTVDLFAQGSYISAEAEAINAETDGWGVDAGIRAMVAPRLELGASVQYVDDGTLDSTTYEGHAYFNVVGGLALAAEYLTDPDADQSTTLFGLRYSF